MHTYFINIARNGHHLFDVTCEAHRYTQQQVASLAMEFREKFVDCTVTVLSQDTTKRLTAL